MNTPSDSAEHPFAKRGSNRPLPMFITSLSAAICLGLAFGVVFEAFAIAAGGLFALGHTYLIVSGAIIACATLWLAVWCFARSWHVEHRLRLGQDVDQPTLSLLGNLRTGRAQKSEG
jgi:uncharacterized membrane protein YidH (DUF202 family)